MAKSHNDNCPPGQSLVDFKLDLIITKVEGLEACMFGDDAGRDGLKIDVDRLKRSQPCNDFQDEIEWGASRHS